MVVAVAIVSVVVAAVVARLVVVSVTPQLAQLRAGAGRLRR